MRHDQWGLRQGGFSPRGAAVAVLVVAALGVGCSNSPRNDRVAPTYAGVGLPDTTVTVDALPDAPVTMMGRSTPVRLQIPAIGVDTGLMGLGLKADGTMEVPPEGFPAGWYTGAPTPGELGPAILAGHVDWAGAPAVFYDLRQLAAGDEITVVRKDGTAAVFRVTGLEQYAKESFPTEVVYGDIQHAGLRLITCGGSFDRSARSYVDNLVAFAELIGTRAPAQLAGAG